MRTDPRYPRVKAMLTDEAVPRTSDGGICLCHRCQRRVYFANGFMQLAVQMVDYEARFGPSAHKARRRA